MKASKPTPGWAPSTPKISRDLSDHHPRLAGMFHSQVPTWAALKARLRRSSLSRAEDSACARSQMTAASVRRGIEMTVRNSWMESAFSAGDLLTNGPWPLTAPQMADAATTRRQVLVPLGPNRIAAHSRNGNGAYTNAGAVAERTPTPPNTTTHTVKRPTTNRAGSR